MQEIKKERIIYDTCYEAIDGTVFNSAEECKKYESSAKAVLLARYNPLVVTRKTEEILFNVGSCDYEIDVVKFPDDEEIDTVLQLIALFNPHYKDEELQRFRKKLTEAVKNDDFILIGRGYNYDDYCVIDTLTDFINKIVKQCDPLTRVILEDEEVVE